MSIKAMMAMMAMMAVMAMMMAIIRFGIGCPQPVKSD
jgi:hypothetical protein